MATTISNTIMNNSFVGESDLKELIQRLEYLNSKIVFQVLAQCIPSRENLFTGIPVEEDSVFAPQKVSVE